MELDSREQALARLAIAFADGSDAAGAITEARKAGATAEEIEAIASIADARSNTATAEALVESLVPSDSPWTESEDVQLRGHVTRVVRRRGSRGPTLVLCHSLGMDHRMWEPLLAALPADLDVLSYDVRNHGHYQEPTADFDIPTCADDLNDILNHAGIDKIYLAGISMGGAISQEFSIRYQDRLAGLTLMGTRGKGRPTGEERASAGEQLGLESQIAVTLSRWLSPGFLAVNGPWVRYARQRVLGWNVKAWALGWRALGTTNTAGRLSTVTVPALCIAGADDSSSQPAVLQALADLLPDSRLEVVPGPHLFPMEIPEIVADLIDKHHATVPQTKN